MPDADGLGGDAKLAGDLGLADASGKQLGRAQPAGLELVAVLLCRRAARNGWHPRILTHQAAQLQPGPRDLNQTPKRL
jgi:hypothetical protein